LLEAPHQIHTREGWLFAIPIFSNPEQVLLIDDHLTDPVLVSHRVEDRVRLSESSLRLALEVRDLTKQIP
jgi:hypothetical protein